MMHMASLLPGAQGQSGSTVLSKRVSKQVMCSVRRSSTALKPPSPTTNNFTTTYTYYLLLTTYYLLLTTYYLLLTTYWSRRRAFRGRAHHGRAGGILRAERRERAQRRPRRLGFRQPRPRSHGSSAVAACTDAARHAGAHAGHVALRAAGLRPADSGGAPVISPLGLGLL